MKRSIKLLAGIAFIFSASLAWGQSCTTTTQSVRFGPYNYRSSTPLNANGELAVTCDSNTAFTVLMNPGQNSGNSFNPRIMRSLQGAGSLNYNLYIDPSHTKIWGDNTSSTFIQSHDGSSQGKSFVVYGQIPARQTTNAGDYFDAITVTVQW